MSGPSDAQGLDLRRAAQAGLAYFAVVFAAGSLLGTLRVLLLLPSFGESAAVLIELPLILGIAWRACRWLAAAFGVAPNRTPRLMMGGLAFATLMAAEFGLSVLVFGRGFADHVDQYREVHALLGLAGQVAFGLFPLMQLPTRPKMS